MSAASTFPTNTVLTLHPSLKSFTLQDLQDHLIDGAWLMIYILVSTLLLEAWSYETALALYRKNPSLYVKALALNFVNHFFLGCPGYAFTVTFLATSSGTPALPTSLAVLCTIVTHSICFFYLHGLFHTHKSLYKWHKFHHLFNTHVPPISANAVSLVEYTVGYLSPFALAMLLFPCTSTSLSYSIQIISLCNIAMHAPPLEKYYDPFLPKWIVATAHHMEHHRRLNSHYAAPTFNLDYILENAATWWTVWNLDKTVDDDDCDTSSPRRASGMEKGNKECVGAAN